MAEFVQYRGNSREAVAIVREVVTSVLQGGGAAPAETVLLPGALALLSKIQRAFIAKARGGVDEAGIQWPPLKRETIAQRRIGAGDLAAIGVRGTRIPANRTRGLLTPAEDQQWRKIFASRLAMLRARGMEDSEAKSRAAQIAWSVLKAQGAKTKLQVLGGRTVEIGRDTGALFRSLTPGIESEEQICEAAPGRITVGTNIPYALPFHRNRPLWPSDGLPATWNDAIAKAVGRALLTAIADAVRNGSV